MFNLMDSHDTMRLVTKAGSRNKALQMLAVMFAMPGSPCIYYGTEVFLEGGKDPDCRRCMPWKDIESGKCDEEMDIIKQLIYLRKTNTAMSSYEMSFEHVEGKDRLLCLKKNDGENNILIIVNFSDKQEEVSNLLDGTKVLFKNGFNAQTRTLDSDGILIAQSGF